MPHSLLKDQNNSKYIKPLQASSAAYKNARSKEYLFTYLLILLACFYTYVYLFLKDEKFKHYLFGVSFFITVATWILTDYFKGNTAKGALLKEKFDTLLFGIEWKFLLPEVKDHEIDDLADSYTGAPIQNWYPDNISENITKSAAIAICQRVGSFWDIELRKKFVRSLLIFVALFTLLVMGLILYTDADLKTVFLLFFSLLSFYSHFISLIRGSLSALKKRKKILEVLDKEIKQKRSFTDNELRDIQDAIFSMRLEPSKVHDWFYKKYNERIRKRCEKYIAEINEEYTHW